QSLRKEENNKKKKKKKKKVKQNPDEKKASASADEVLMNTKAETSDLRWTIHSRTKPEWEEVSGLDEENNSVRTYQICQTDSSASHWLRSRLIQRRDASQVYVELRFTMMECSSRATHHRSCKETFNLYYYEADANEATDTHPPWMENPYTKVDTVAADFLLRKGGERKFNVKTLRLGPLSMRGFYLAFQAQGACMALLSVRVFFKKCPALVSALSAFPETVPRTLVQEAEGSCVVHAALQSGGGIGSRPRPPKLFCGEDGQWVGQPTTSCACQSGFEPTEGQTGCTECPMGQFKAGLEGQCTSCPVSSKARGTGSTVCECLPDYLRAPSDAATSPCTRPPSAPRGIVPHVNETTLTLEWNEPLDRGRNDLTYAVRCSMCGVGQRQGGGVAGGAVPCTPCGDSVSYRPAHHGLVERRVEVWGLLPHTTYTFSVDALNGSVSTESSLTLHWSVPTRPHYTILQYQLRYCEKERQNPEQQQCHYKESHGNQVVLSDLRRATQYEVQVRARTMAGYGSFSPAATFRTLPDGERERETQAHHPTHPPTHPPATTPTDHPHQ
ncbi:hypothetical protein CRUP_022274, partial [Coryphaenoides rupestris]